MKRSGLLQQSLCNILPLLFLFPIPFVSIAQQTGVWERFEVKEKMTDAAVFKKRNSTFLFSAKADDNGMNFEMSSVWSNDKKRHTYRGQVAWEWTNLKGPSMLIPGEKVTIKGIISNLSGEPGSSICAYAVFGNWGFMKPQS